MAEGPGMGPTRKVRKPASNSICSSTGIRDVLEFTNWFVKQLAKQMHMSTAIIDDWLGADHTAVLPGGPFTPAPVIA